MLALSTGAPRGSIEKNDGSGGVFNQVISSHSVLNDALAKLLKK